MKYILFLFIIISFATSCTESNVSTNNQTPSCNLSDLSIFPHPNDAGVTLSVLVMDKQNFNKSPYPLFQSGKLQTKENRIIGIGNEVCEGYKLYRIMPNGIELKNNDGQINQIAYASSNIIAQPAIKIEQANRESVKQAEQLQKYGIPQAMKNVQSTGTRENAMVNFFTGTRFTGK